ncbi:MAG: DUF4347 domain-containing protein, partial [Trichodesmium erythraeum GBRTRLIN201]|nr:DUF4347 domain-containing protein [Trichodesmium erythraeum GBRTRLIN201]
MSSFNISHSYIERLSKTSYVPNEIDYPEEIVFIDSSVGGYQRLANGVLPGIKVVIIDPSSDGFGQIFRALEEQPQVLSIHIVCHGTPGCLSLGNGRFNIKSIQSSHTIMLQLEALSVNNILIYGCYVAAGNCGREFIEKLHQLTGANIAASAKLIGSIAFGATWELGFVRGELQVVVPFTKQIQRTWGYVLAAFDDRPAVYQIKEGILKELNPLTRQFIEIGDTGKDINAAGLNRADNYMYAMERVTGTSHRLVRIDSTGTVEYVTSSGGVSSNSADAFTITTTNSSKPAAGDVDDKGYFWVLFKSEDELEFNSSVYRIKLTDPSHVSTGKIDTNWIDTNWNDIPEDVAYVNADSKDYLFGVGTTGLIFRIDITAAGVDQDVSKVTTLRPARTGNVFVRDANGNNSNTNLLLGDFVSFNPLTGAVYTSFEAAWTSSEGGLYVSKNGQAYNLANFSPDQDTLSTPRAAEELVSNTDGQTDQATDGMSTSDLSSVFHIPLIDLNGTETGDKNLDDVDYDAGTFTEGDPAVDIVETTTGTVPNPENPSNPVFNNGLIIKDYINISDPDNITTATNTNNSGVVSAGSRLTTATVTLTNAYDGDELLVRGATVADGASATVGNITIARVGTGNTAGTNNIALTLTPTTATGTTASVDDFEAAIIAIQFKNDSENPNTTNRTIQFVLTDADGNTSDEIFGPDSGGRKHTTTVAVQAVNDAPVLDLDGNNSSTATGSDYITTFTEGGGAVAIGDSDVSITDADDINIESATITLGSRPDGDTVESLLVNGTLPTGITASSYNSTTGVITLTGSATLAEYQTAIAQIQYNNTSENPNTTDRTVTVVVNDGNVDSNTATTTINITPVNDAPVLDLDGDNSTTTGSDYITTFTEGTAVNIGDSDVSITDVDDSNIESATITLSSRPDGDTVESLSAGTLPTGITASSYDSSTGVITLTGPATLAEYQTAIAQIQYNNTSDNPDTSARTVTVVV